MVNKTAVVLAVLVTVFLLVTGCPRPPITPPIPTNTQFVLLDDFSDGDNRTNISSFGGYWYTFDDLAAKTTSSQCGSSSIYPPSDSYLVKNGINVTPTFVMSSYTASSQMPPAGMTSGFYARVSGTVNRDITTGYQYGFVGFGANLLEVAGDGFKNTVNASAAGYTSLKFWYKNGPSVTGAIPWKVKLSSTAPIGAGPCTMEEVDNHPVYAFSSSDDWTLFNVPLSSFAPEDWGSQPTSCSTRGTPTNCVAGFTSYLNGGAQYKCTAPQALVYLNAIQWQTNFTTSFSGNSFDLMIARVELVK